MLGDFEAKGKVEPAVQAYGTTQINRTKLFPINKQLVPIDVVSVETEDGLDSVFEACFEPGTLPAAEVDNAACWQEIEYHWHDGLVPRSGLHGQGGRKMSRRKECSLELSFRALLD